MPKPSQISSLPFSSLKQESGSKVVTPQASNVIGNVSNSVQKAEIPHPSLPGFSREQIKVILQQVALAAFLFKAEVKSPTGQVTASFIQTLQMMQKCIGMNQELGTLLTQIQQDLSHPNSISPEEKNQMMTQLDTIFEQLAEMEKGFPEEQKIGVEQEKTLSNDPLLNVTQSAKAKTENMISQMQNQVEAKFSKLLEQTGAKSNLTETSSPANATAKDQAAQVKLNTSSLAHSSSPVISPADKASAPPNPSTLSPTNAAGQQLDKSSQHTTQIILSSADLHALAAKLQKKELTAPMNIALLYPLEKQRSSDSISSVKTSADKNRENSSGGAMIGGNEKVQEMVLIPAGPTMMRDDSTKEREIVELPNFLIAVHPVTNAQFADWLNEMYSQNAIQLSENGIIFDKNRQVLCKTNSADSTSQIEAVVSNGQLIFRPLRATDQHPVVQVSALGAENYCATYNFRLPSEVEWEKAAGMPSDPFSEQLLYFEYGCGQNEMDVSWANFRDELQEYPDNRTTPVGFYNGETVFTKQGKNYQSKKAISPFGCYDMSGNVRQWTSDEKTSGRVTKGGSYNSAPDELLINASKLLDSHSCYADTGFRVVFDIL